jgi:hypothetical protein
MDAGQPYPLTSDDLARMEHRAKTACEEPKRNAAAYRMAVDVLRLLDERRRLLLPPAGEQGRAAER